MVKIFLLALLITTICGSIYAAPVVKRDVIADLPQYSYGNPAPILADQEDLAGRNQRSANLSHVTGTARKIQMFIKNRDLQILPDGTVNGTTDDTSSYTILQRMTVGIGQVKIQGVATCQYLCMASCGALYGSVDFSDECVFNESISQSNYNMYTSTKYSNDKRTYYLALNRRGQSRKVFVRSRTSLGKLSSYTRVLTRTVPAELQVHPIRHQSQICSIHPLTDGSSQTQQGPDRCPKKQKKKKKKKKKKKPCLKKPIVCQNRLKKQQERLKAKCDVNKNSEICQRDNQNEQRLVGGKPNVKKKRKKVGLGKTKGKKLESKRPKLLSAESDAASVLGRVYDTTVEPKTNGSSLFGV